MFKLRNNSLVSFMFVIICLFTIVCSSFNTNMIIGGDANIRVNANVRITNIKLSNAVNGGFETYNSKFSKNSISSFVTLPNIDSKLTYEVTITNFTNDVYVIENIANSSSNSNFLYTMDNFKVGEVLRPLSDTKIYITYNYVDDLSNLPNNIEEISSILFTFSRPTASMIQYSNSCSNCNTVQCALDQLFNVFGG